MNDFTLSPPPLSSQGTTAYVVLERGPIPDQRYDITAVISTIGRSPQNEIVINDPEMSRRHAQIVQQGDYFTVEDLGSTNGTFVNGQRCTGATPLRHGDRIEFGDTVSLVFYQTAVPSQTMPSPPLHLEDEDTADLPPVKPPPRQPAAAPYSAQDQYLPAEAAEPTRRSNRLALGCVLALVLLTCCCGLLLVALDSYQQGQYLYCGGSRPLWELILGPLGFNPLCP
ncbi:MAG TPA: FHA domain-containing protein [Chloroflexota bacterium]|nr:FHA domain-containing protein [Chloroflexota bacterium]